MLDSELQQLTHGLSELATALGPRAQDANGPLWLALDQGGHASRALVFDQHGHIVTQAFAAISTRRLGDHRVEHDADEIVESLRLVIDDVAQSLGRDVDLIRGAGLATQRSSVVCWDARNGQPLSPVLSWQDRRNAALVAQLQPQQQTIQRETGLVLSPHYGASKLRWCLDHLPAVQQAQQQSRLHAGPLAGYLLRALLEQHPHVIDPGNASRTQLWSPASGDWSEPLLQWFGIPRDILPRCVPTQHEFGSLRMGDREVPLVVCTGDQAAVPFANGQPSHDSAYLNLGTGAFVLVPLDTDPGEAAPLLRSVLRADANTITYALEGTVNGAGAALDWLAARSSLDVQRTIASLNHQQVALLHPPLFLNGVGGVASPFWLAEAPVSFVEQTAATTDLDRLVAVVESIAFLIHTNLQWLRQHQPHLHLIQLGGGLSRCDYVCEALGTLSGLPAVRLRERELTGRGLAWLVAQASKDPTAHWSASPQEPFATQKNPALLHRYQRWLLKMSELHPDPAFKPLPA